MLRGEGEKSISSGRENEERELDCIRVNEEPRRFDMCVGPCITRQILQTVMWKLIVLYSLFFGISYSYFYSFIPVFNFNCTGATAHVNIFNL